MRKGIFERTVVPQAPKVVHTPFDDMPCTVPITAIPTSIKFEELVASKFMRNLSITKADIPTPDERAKLIDDVDTIFHSYDKIQLLGALGLHLIYVIAVRNYMLMDEDIEVILEYAMSFAYADSTNVPTSPTDEVVIELYKKLLLLKKSYTDIEYLSSLDSESTRDLLNHIGFINVRGDGYPKFIEKVFNEYFSLHQDFIASHYAGATVPDIQILLQHVEQRILPRLHDSYGMSRIGYHMLHEQWVKWMDENEVLDPKTGFSIRQSDHQNHIMGDFMNENPELPQTKDGRCLIYACNDYKNSDSIFSLIPRNDKDRALLDAFSIQLGDNHEFMEGEFRGAIMNYATIIRQKPFLKYNGKYYCFSILLPHRRMFAIATDLFKADPQYREFHFLGNEFEECRDNYTERKVYELFSKKFSEVRFYQSVHYVGEVGEMDILGISPNAIYLIEVKAYQLTDSYRGGTIGIERKLRESVAKGAEQTIRSEKYIQENDNPVFTCHGESNIQVSKSAPIFRLCVTLEHYGPLTGNMRGLVSMGIIDNDNRDIWIASLYDLMTIIENIKDENALIQYLTLHNSITTNDNVQYLDELDVFGAFLQNPAILENPPRFITGYSSDLDKKYNGVVL